VSQLPGVRRQLTLVVRIASLAWLVGHFALTVAYVAPLNPATLPLRPLLDATIGRYFEQNWGMFAPNPRSGEAILLVRPLSAAEAAALPDQGLPPTGWYDLSTPLWDGFYRNRLSAYDRLGRPASRAMLAYLNGGPELGTWQETCLRGDAAACAYYAERLAEARARAGTLLARIGSAALHDLGQDAEPVTHVALRARLLDAVPWSERYAGTRETHDVELGTYPLVRGGATSGLPRRGAAP
jgi:hypothetical protein